ncbi:hypothetical protein [Glycomyces sp. NPDC021274]|uniref:hypothetical protein n=1 Tax=Glycomyces sp. NPDC021274 TaxID=3155120 RepID=UPI0033F05159
MTATPPPERPNPLADELDLLLADAMWAYESRQDISVLKGLTEQLRAEIGDPAVARAASLLQWGRPSEFEDEDLDWDDWAKAQVELAAVLLEADVTAAADLQGRAAALRRLADLRGQGGSARKAVAVLIDLADVQTQIAAADPAAGLPDLADTFTRLAKACRRAGGDGDDTEQARYQGDAARYQLRAAEMHCALIGSGGEDQRAEALGATWFAAELVEEADGAAAAVPVSAAALRLAERHAAELEPPQRLQRIDVALATHASRLARADLRDTALRCSQQRLNLYEWPGGVHYDAERHARALQAHAVLLRDAGFPETAIPVLERAADTALAAVPKAAQPSTQLDQALRLVTALREAHEAAGESEAALRQSERAVDLHRQVFELIPKLHRARQFRSAVEAHQARLAEHGRDDDPVGFAHIIIAVFERIEGQSNTALAELLCAKLCELDDRGHYSAALALGDREVPLREAIAQAAPEAPQPELARALVNRGLMYSRLGRHSEAVPDFVRAVALHEAVVAAASDGADRKVVKLSEALYDHASSLECIGEYRQAQAAIERCIALREALAETDPDEHLRRLASAQNLLANIQHEHREFTASLAARDRAERIYESLLDTDPGTAWNLALVRSGRAATYVNAHRDREALETGRAAAAAYEELYAEDPTRARPDFARTLRNLCITLGNLGLLDEAARTAERALVIQEAAHRETAEGTPGSLADALDRYSLALAEIGRTAEAVAHAERACELVEGLLATDRRVHLADAVRILGNTAGTLADDDKNDEALAVSRRALGLARELTAAGDPDGPRYLTTCLLNHGNRLSAHGLSEEALAIAEEGVELAERVPAGPGAACTLAKARINLGRRLDALGRTDAAIEVTDKAIALLEASPESEHDLEVLDTLATAYGNQAQSFADTRRAEEAEAAGRRAVALQERRAALGHRPTVLPDLRNKVSWHAFRLGDLDRHAEAVEQAEYALELSREIDDPEDITNRELDLAGLLQDLALPLADDGDPMGAFAANQRSMALVRSAYARRPETDERQRCGALLDWTWALTLVGRVNEALQASFETVEAVERRYGGEPECNYWQALALDNVATSLGAVGRTAEALDWQRRATTAWRTRLADKDTPGRRADLAWSLRYEAQWMSGTGADPQATAAVSASAVDLYREAVEAVPDQRGDAAIALSEHAVNLEAAAVLQEAVAAAEGAVGALEALAETEPDKRPHLAQALRNQARVHARAGFEDAFAIALRSVDLWSELFALVPRAYGFELGETLSAAAAIGLRNDPNEAVPLAERAVALLEAAEREEPGAYASRLDRARSTLQACRAATSVSTSVGARHPRQDAPAARARELRTRRA